MIVEWGSQVELLFLFVVVVKVEFFSSLDLDLRDYDGGAARLGLGTPVSDMIAATAVTEDLVKFGC